MIRASDRFHELATSSVRPLEWDVAISFTREQNQNLGWFTLDSSALDGEDLLAANLDNPTQWWDAYQYSHLQDRLISMDISQSVAFPYNVQSSIADFSLDNHDQYFTYSEDNSSSPIGEYILPKRPCRLYLGFKGGGVLPMFVGLTQGLPEYSGEHDTVAKMTAMDFLSEIGEMSLKNMLMMKNVRTDEVLAAILQQFGIDSGMYHLDPGLNTIPFVFFESGKNAGNAMRELIQAENGALWLNEEGIIRFQPRTSVIGQTPVMIFDKDNTISIKPSRTDGIVNTVKVSSEIRAVQKFQPIFYAENNDGYTRVADEDSYRIGANRSLSMWLSLEDPAWSATLPVLNGAATSSFFTAVDLAGTPINSGITVTGELLADSYKITFTNANSSPVSISYLELWGEPAKIIDEIKYEAYDEDSVNRYGTMLLEVTNNNCFGSYKNVDSYASDVLSKYAKYSSTITMKVKGNPALQLQDIITVDIPDYEGDYQITSITRKLNDSKLDMTITGRKITRVSPFILDQSELDGTDVLS